jgi:hypothetical protein
VSYWRPAVVLALLLCGGFATSAGAMTIQTTVEGLASGTAAHGDGGEISIQDIPFSFTITTDTKSVGAVEKPTPLASPSTSLTSKAPAVAASLATFSMPALGYFAQYKGQQVSSVSATVNGSTRTFDQEVDKKTNHLGFTLTSPNIPSGGWLYYMPFSRTVQASDTFDGNYFECPSTGECTLFLKLHATHVTTVIFIPKPIKIPKP